MLGRSGLGLALAAAFGVAAGSPGWAQTSAAPRWSSGKKSPADLARLAAADGKRVRKNAKRVRDMARCEAGRAGAGA